MALRLTTALAWHLRTVHAGAPLPHAGVLELGRETSYLQHCHLWYWPKIAAGRSPAQAVQS